MRVLTRSNLEILLPFELCIELMREAMISTSERNCVLPLRQSMTIPERAGKLVLMPGYLGGEGKCFGVKIVSKFERASGDTHGSHVGAVLLFNAETGLPLALLEGGTLTAIRTASMTALATQTLASADARHLLIIGTGEEAWYHARAVLKVRPFQQLTIWGRERTHAEALALRVQAVTDVPVSVSSDLAATVPLADVICTVTSAKEPILKGNWLTAGTHINLVGSAIASTAEVDDIAVVRSRFFVDYREAALAQAGELITSLHNGVVTEAHILAEIGEILAHKKIGRQSPADITLYKSLGVTTQDLAAAHFAWRSAVEQGLGEDLDLNL